VDEQDHARSLRRIAARVLNRNVELGLSELDRITIGIDDAIRMRFVFLATVFCLFTLLLVVALIGWATTGLGGKPLGNDVAVFLAALGVGALIPLLYWRHFQYGLNPIRSSKAALYAGANKASIEALESLFAHLRHETAPRSFVYRADGKKLYLDRRYYFGRLRALLLAEEANVRSSCLPPKGLWFSGMIHVEASADEIIKAIHAKPRAGGRKRAFDYATMLLRMIGHPALNDFEPGPHGSQTQLMNLIRDLCEPNDEDETGIALPEESTLRQFAKDIEAALKKNRALKR
jgi:hypothetical protein